MPLRYAYLSSSCSKSPGPSRGPCSSTTTVNPARDSSRAMTPPAAPDPTTTKSTVSLGLNVRAVTSSVGRMAKSASSSRVCDRALGTIGESRVNRASTTSERAPKTLALFRRLFQPRVFLQLSTRAPDARSVKQQSDRRERSPLQSYDSSQASLRSSERFCLRRAMKAGTASALTILAGT